MNRLRVDLLRRANGALLQQFFSSEAAPSFRDQPARRTASPRTQWSRFPAKLEDQAETIRQVTMNPIAIVNTTMHDNENEYIYKYIHRKLEERYRPVNLDHLKNSQIYEQIQELKQILKQHRPDYDWVHQVSENIRMRVQGLNLDEIEILLTMLRGVQHDETRQIARLVDLRLHWMLKNNRSIKLSDNLDRWFYLADLLYESRIKSVFNKTLTSLLAQDLRESELSNQQVLHLLFLIILERHSNYLLPKYERRIFDILGKASIEDLSIICLAYFKTKTMIKDKRMLSRILGQTTKNLPNVDPKDPAYCSIVKSVRYSRDPNNRDAVVQLITTLSDDPEHRIMFGSSYNAVHTIKLMEAFRIYEPRMLHILRCLIFGGLGEFRIKDIQYALTSLSNLTYMDLQPDEGLIKDFDRLVDDIVSQTRQDQMHQNFHLMPIIRAFSVFGYHSPKIMAYALDVLSNRAEVAKMRSVLEFEKSTLLAHITAAIEHGDTSLLQVRPLLDHCSSSVDRHGNQGSIGGDSSLRHIGNILSGGRPRLQNNSELFRHIAESLASHAHLRDGGYRFNFQWTFPHQNYSDLVITRNSPEPGQFDLETLLPRAVPAETKTCIVFALQRTDYIDGQNRLCGYKRMLMRMMKRLGYFVLPVDLHQPDINGLAQKVETIMGDRPMAHL